MQNFVDDDLEVPEFNFEGAVPNPFVEQYRQGVTVNVIKANGAKERYVLLDPDVAKKFRSPKSVNAALRRAMKSQVKTGTKGRGVQVENKDNPTKPR